MFIAKKFKWPHRPIARCHFDQVITNNTFFKTHRKVIIFAKKDFTFIGDVRR